MGKCSFLFITEYSPEIQGGAAKAWNANYSKHFGGANIIAAQYYDALLLIAAAVKSGGPTRSGIRTGLAGLDQVHGIVGDYTFTDSRDGIHRFFLTRVVDGKLSLVKTLSEPDR